MSSIDDLVDQARRALAGDLPPVPEEGAVFTGTADDGLISAEVGADGRVHGVALDPEALKQPLDEVMSSAAAAINAALDARPGRLDLTGAVEMVDALRAVAREQMTKFAVTVDETETRVHAARTRS